MPEGEGQGDVAAVAEAQNVRLCQTLLVHEGQQVVGELGDGKGGGSPGRFSVPPGVHGINGEVPGKFRDLVDEIGAVFSVAVEQQERRTTPLLSVKQFHVHGLTAPARSSEPSHPPGPRR